MEMILSNFNEKIMKTGCSSKPAIQGGFFVIYLTQNLRNRSICCSKMTQQ